MTANVDISKLLAAHLYEHPPVNGIQYKSSFVALLVDARGAAERDATSGEVLPGRHSTSWLGAAGYLVLLDQIGTCFAAPGRPATDEATLLQALRAFSPISDEPTLRALYALRCSLAHDYALYNDGSTRDGKVRPLLRHAFNFSADTVSPLVKLPTKTWSGVYDPSNPPPEEETTVVNLRKLGDLVEGVVAELRRRHAAGDLEIRLSPAEFQMRYGIRYGVLDHPPA